jgi:ABC-type xylose transport system substrate-binding protein
MRLSRLALVVLALAACQKAPEARAPAQNAPLRIGFSMDTLKEERWQFDKRLVEQRASTC